MDIPYGFDCYAFSQNEAKYFKSANEILSTIIPFDPKMDSLFTQQNGHFNSKTNEQIFPPFIRFTRKNEEYTADQLAALASAGRLQQNEIQNQSNKKIFCGIKIQLGISVVSNFLKRGMQYKKPNKGRSELINGTWGGIVSGLTVDRNAPNSYDIAFGNFLAYDEEFPYIKFGPFFAIESKLVMLTGSARSLEASSFGTNIQSKIWFGIFFLMFILSLLASLRVYSQQHSKNPKLEQLIKLLFSKLDLDYNYYENKRDFVKDSSKQSFGYMLQNFFFIYFTMLLNKPSLEFDDFIWPKHDLEKHKHLFIKEQLIKLRLENSSKIKKLFKENKDLREIYHEIIQSSKLKRKPLPISIRIVSYLWSAACLVMASIYSGEMLAVILLHADQNIDTIAQLINSKPQIVPVIRQDDFTYSLMLKSLDKNMLILHNMTKIVPRPEVYTRNFIESVSERKQALLGDDELIETIYEIYHKYFPLYRSKVTYLQYPISIMYRNDLNVNLELKLRRGLKQVFEFGLLSRWYQAQKETYINFYDSENKDNRKFTSDSNSSSDAKYKPLSMQHFKSFFRLMFYCILIAFLVLILEIFHFRFSKRKIHDINHINV